MTKIVVLVHGTFAKNAPWTQYNSRFVEGLKLRLGANTVIKVFNWSGRNSYNDRILAGEELAAFLNQILTYFPLAEKIVIGHSHGGNVIFYALKSAPHLVGNFKVITLATPFLISSLKDNLFTNSVVGFLLSKFLPWALFFVLLVIMLLPILAITFTYYEKFQLLVLLPLAIPLIIIPVLYEYIIEKAPESEFYFNKANNIYQKVKLSATSLDVPLLSITYKYDEAKILLAFSNEITTLATKVLDIISKSVRHGSFLVGRIFILFLFTMIILVVIKDLLSYPLYIYVNKLHETIWLYLIEIGVGLWLLLILGLLILSFIYHIFSANPLFYGWKGWIHFVFVKTVPSSIPMHVRNCTSVEFVVRKKSLITLRHCQIYDDPIVLDFISNWLKGLIKSSIAVRVKMKK